ncbi:CDP-glycerol glycerophosphotransferase family protein [Bacillus sp. TL12]|uniref:bifunctional glycosyltransferase/CDP-glycerol:glycerophosphate glycerophosphotransferase n=1 Tax=Bacillus sp. TL12 TaxID=2894756 RepID=UPI001F51A1AB|nr:CDP-glycerol glycerophosphotransferase family protein [Bacillus sp. TL12]MCI0766661.1 bifunctional glycosyltransferase family 2 protein/CDP-glycerol:glycerophosphate glycerophosphotransferase [Bacillus sp. TL12]
MNIISLGYETGTILSMTSNEKFYVDIDYTLGSVISVMSPALNINPKLIQPAVYNKQVILANELNKRIVKDIEELGRKKDYIIIDLLDERYNLLKYKDTMILDSWLLKDSNLYSEIKGSSSVISNVDFNLWQKQCDEFIKLLNTYFANRVIIHEMYLSEQYLKDGEFTEFRNINEIRAWNGQLRQYYKYLKEHVPNAKVISIEKNNYSDLSLIKVLNPAKKNEQYIEQLVEEIQSLHQDKEYTYNAAVVIASYNVENYIEEAIQSVLKQTLENVQVVVVDDGSKDKTQNIIRDMASKHTNITYQFLENTGSPSEPRNVGISLADAKYITFLDGDDYLGLDACEKMYSYAEEQQADLVVGKMMSFVGESFFESSKVNPRFAERYKYESSIEGYKETHIKHNPILYLFPSSCAKFYKSELIQRTRFNKHIKYGEDFLFAVESFFDSRKTILIEDFVYYYRGRRETDNESTTQQKTLKNLSDLQIALGAVDKIINKNVFSIARLEKFHNDIQYYRMLEANQHIANILDYPENEQVQALKIIKDTLFSKGFDQEKIKIFSIMNYVKLSLLITEKYGELITLSQLLNKVTMYDYVDQFPFKTLKRNDNLYFSFMYKKKEILVDITHVFESTKLVNRLLDIKFMDNQMVLRGLAYFNNISITNKKDIKHTIVMKHRKNEIEYRFTPDYAYNNKFSSSRFKYGHGGYEVIIQFDGNIEPGGYDFFIETDFLGVQKSIALGGMNNKFIYKANNYFMESDKGRFEVIPIVKTRSKLALNYKKFNSKWEYLKRRVVSNMRKKQYSMKQIKNNNYISKSKKLKLFLGVVTEDISHLLLHKKEIWLVGEKLGDSAGDTGYWFFKHCREKYPSKNVYYLIDKKSPDYAKVKKLGRVVPFYSLKHIIYSMNAKYVFSSDNVNILLPSNIKHLRKATRVFIQHGIILPGRVENVYHSNKDLADYILTSSNLETQIIKNHFGYNSEEIWNCGLPRFDTLQNKEREKRIMMTFTWRKNIQNLEQLMESKYFTAIQSLLHNSKFIKTLERNNIILDVCLHPRTCQLLEEDNSGILNSLKTSPNIEIHDFNKANVRELIERSSMMLTDYSSISFDFVYLEKPIINYLFQNNTPISEENIKNVLPGYVSYSEDDVIHAVESYLVKQRRLKKINKKHYIKYDDGRNCDRLVKFASGSR